MVVGSGVVLVLIACRVVAWNFGQSFLITVKDVLRGFAMCVGGALLLFGFIGILMGLLRVFGVF